MTARIRPMRDRHNEANWDAIKVSDFPATIHLLSVSATVRREGHGQPEVRDVSVSPGIDAHAVWRFGSCDRPFGVDGSARRTARSVSWQAVRDGWTETLAPSTFPAAQNTFERHHQTTHPGCRKNLTDAFEEIRRNGLRLSALRRDEPLFFSSKPQEDGCPAISHCPIFHY